MRVTYLLTLLIMVPLGGCATHAVDKNYGSAYEQMVREQTFDASTRNTGQGDRVIEGVDPNSANAALETMRKDTAGRGIRTGPTVNITNYNSGGGGGGDSGGGGGGGSGGSQ